MVLHLLGLVCDQEIQWRGSQKFGVTSPNTGLTDIPQGHFLTPIYILISLHPSPLFPSTAGEDSKKELDSPWRSCPQGSYVYRSHCYALFMNPKSWIDADVSRYICG